MKKQKMLAGGVIGLVILAVYLTIPKTHRTTLETIKDKANQQGWAISSIRGDSPIGVEPIVICEKSATKEQLTSLVVGTYSKRWIGKVFITHVNAIASEDWGPNSRVVGDLWLFGDLDMMEILTEP